MAFGAHVTQVDVVDSQDPAVLEGKIAASFAAQVLAHPVSQLIEIALAGGGAGGVLQATIYYSTTEDGNFPPVADQHVRVFFASDRETMRVKIEDFYLTVPVDRTTFVEKVAQGDGIQWIDLIVYTLLDLGPTFVERVAVEATAGLSAAVDAPVVADERAIAVSAAVERAVKRSASRKRKG